MKRIAMGVACLLAAACGGGGGGSKANPATQASFDYSQATAAAAPVGSADATSAAVASLTSFDGSPDVTRASNVVGALFDAADQALGSAGMLGVAPASRALPLVNRVRGDALTVGGMPDSSLPAGCGVVAGDVVTFDPAVCVFTDTSSPGESITVKLGGHVARLSAGAAEWSLSMSATIAMSTSSGQVTVDAGFQDSGNVAIAVGSVTGHEEATMRVVGRAQGQTLTLSMAQAADLAVATAPATTCATRITGGTFEAKRIWLEVPQQARDQDPDQYRNRGVKIEWTGCGTARAWIVVK